mmetsp:Transcript_93738/g.201219  ORF Transcript_93738/g.201219 Transcript_93738/m.201219 type:complete len:251 (-) Transcript_93738:1777-2529(-)
MDVLPLEGVPAQLLVLFLAPGLVARSTSGVQQGEDLAGDRGRGIASEANKAAAQQRQCRLDALRHYLAELTSDREATSPMRACGFDEEQLTTHGRDTEAHSHTHHETFSDVRLEELYTDDVLQMVRIHSDDAGGIGTATAEGDLTFGVTLRASAAWHAEALHTKSSPPADPGKQSFQIPHPALRRPLCDDCVHGLGCQIQAWLRRRRDGSNRRCGSRWSLCRFRLCRFRRRGRRLGLERVKPTLLGQEVR